MTRCRTAQGGVGVAIVGAQKCGTTTLAAMLDEHPQVRLAIGKEAHLFDRADVQRDGLSPEHIERYWPDARPGEVLLDATPSYLYLPGCLEALLRHSPDVRVIVMLRPPAERLVSHWRHERRFGAECRGFTAALLAERRRLRRSTDPLASDSAQRHASYCDRGRYAAQLARLATLTDRFHVVLLRDLVAEPERVMSEVHRFLELPSHPVGEVPRLNAHGEPTPRLAPWMARARMRREAIRAERFLDLPKGALR